MPRKTAFLEDPDAEKVIEGPVCSLLDGFVREAEKLSELLFDKEEDRAVAEKLRFSFGIVGILEEEIDVRSSHQDYEVQELLENVMDLDDERRDMTRDRAPLDAANKVLQSLLSSLQEVIT